jgi:NAD(P)-dependent dehydrogenase (short-subunit alcohol dehydrogenase family)
MLLKNKTIVITGSSGGIGLAIARACAWEGASVVISSRSDEAVRNAVASLKQDGLDVKGFRADVSSAADVEALLKQAIDVHGRIHVWINNAGISGGYRTLPSLSAAEIESVIATNLLGVLYGCKLVIPHFIEQGGGSIVNIGGKGGKGDASPYLAVYAATKAAVTSLTRSLALENQQHPVSINCLFPGIIETGMWREIKTCPETVSRVEFIPLLIDAWATPTKRVTDRVVGMCAQTPGKQSGRCYSAGSPVRYFKAPFVFLKYYARRARNPG